ncbi:MAG: hypothetical protein VX498_14355 [Myxococcota bacterium]|nr:hypothetical protein [Myxococcota bacterium]
MLVTSQEQPAPSSGQATSRKLLDLGLVSGVGVVFLLARWPLLRGIARTDINDQSTFGLFPYHLSQGLLAGPMSYLPEPQQGCTLLWGLPCAVIYGIQGPTIESLRLCSLFWGLGTLLLFLVLAHIAAGRRAVLLLGGLWVAAPPALLSASHSGLPDHLDVATLTGACLLCLLRARTAGGRGRKAWSFGAGLSAGLALFFILDALFVLVALAGLSAWLTRQPSPRWDWRFGVGGFAAGLSPYLSGSGLWSSVRGQAFLAEALVGSGDGGAAGLVSRSSQMLFGELPAAFGLALSPTHSSLGVDLGTTGLGNLYLLALLVPTLSLVVAGRTGQAPAHRLRRIVGLTALSACLLHLLGFAVSGAPLTASFLLPCWPWLLLAASLGTDRLLERRHTAGFGLSWLLALSLCLGSADDSEPGQRVETGSDEQTYLAHLSGHHLLRHPLGPEVLLPQPGNRLLRLAEERPTEATDLLRLHGRGVARTLGIESLEPSTSSQARRQEARRALSHAREDAGEAGLFFVLVGLGEEAGMASDEDGPAPNKAAQILRKLHAARSFFTAEERPAWDLGVALGIGERLFPLVSETEESTFAPRGLTTDQLGQLCAALGLWTLESSAPTPSPAQLEDSSWCDPRVFAVGAGMALALRLDPGVELPPAAPQLEWWLGPGRGRGSTQDAFSCSFDRAWTQRSARTRGASITPDFGLACLPQEATGPRKSNRASDSDPQNVRRPPP